MADNNDRVRLETRGDGIYLIIENPPDVARVTRKEIMKLIEDCRLTEVNVEAVGDAFKDESEVVERKITNQTKMHIKDESVLIEVAKNKMAALIKFVEGSPMGKAADAGTVRHALDLVGVRHGVFHDDIDRLVAEHQFGATYQIAKGDEPINGENGGIAYHISSNDLDNRPKVLDDGRVDFKQINYFLQASVGQLLAEVVQPKPGKDGMNVLGQAVGHKPGKPAPKLPTGKGTILSDEGMRLSAAISGRVILTNKRIEILPVLEIKGDVGNETGNINFEGSVVVEGELLSGFEIHATGDIEIRGMVNGGVVDAGGRVSLISGIHGSDKAVITSVGDLFTKFAQSCTIHCGGNIVADNILHCTVNCNGAIKMEGRRQLIVGGTLRVGKEIRAGVIGSNMATPTDIVVCNNPGDMETFAELRQTHEAAVKDYNKFSLTVDNILKNANVATMPQEKKDLLMKSLHTKAFLRDKMNELKTRIDELVTGFVGNNGRIYVSQVIHCGVDVLIGDATLHVRDDLERCMLRNEDGRIKIDAY